MTLCEIIIIDARLETEQINDGLTRLSTIEIIIIISLWVNSGLNKLKRCETKNKRTINKYYWLATSL